jgi:putative transposase
VVAPLADAIGDRRGLSRHLEALAERLAEPLQHWGGQGADGGIPSIPEEVRPRQALDLLRIGVVADADGDQAIAISEDDWGSPDFVDTGHEFTGVTVGKWRKRYREFGIKGLHDELRPGRPRTYEDDKVAEVINRALQTKPSDGSTQWSARPLAAETGISKSTVHRWLKTFCIQPHRQKTFKISTDPFFIEKVRDIVGLYLNPPEKAVVLCVVEKTQVQALDRTQPLLPMGLGYVEGVTHDYIRHGTTTLFAALDVATGQVITQCKPRHRHQEYLVFLRQIEKSVPTNLDLDLIVDNYATHKHPKVRAWLSQHSRFHVHYTPTYASWLNQVERWFGIITQRAIRRGSFSSVKELIARIEQFVGAYNRYTAPFI